MSDDHVKNQITFLSFLKANFPKSYHPKQISSELDLPLEIAQELTQEAEVNLWVDVETKIASGSFVKINQKGNEKLDILTGKANPMPEKPSEVHYHFYNTTEGKRMIILGFIIAVVIGVIGMWWTYYVAENSTSQIPKKSSIKTTTINQEIVDCEMLPDGQSGLSYYNKTLGFSVTLPNVNWSIVEDSGYYVSQVGLIEHENFIGGIMIDQAHAPKLLISVFDDSEQKYMDIENFLNEIGKQIGEKMEWKYASIDIDPDKDSGELESGGLYRDRGFYIFERALRTNDRVYLIHYPNFDHTYSENIIEEIDKMYLSVNIFPPCE